MCTYYDGTKLLSLKDINGKQPEIYICTTNRTGGKTTYFSRLLVNRFLKYNEKFVILYRYVNEMDNVADKFFKDIQTLFFSDKIMTSKRMCSGAYHELFIDNKKSDTAGLEKSCGYAIAINNADKIKRYSHLFSDVKRIMFDEFQSESNSYCPDEVKKFISIHTSIARGQGKQVRYVPVYMLSNTVSVINPYFSELGISERLTNKTKFLKGDGYVMEQGYIESVAKAQKESGFNKAFAKNEYVAYSSECVYLNDNLAFIDKPSGKNRYIATIRYNNRDYAIREYYEEGILYCDNSADTSFKLKISVTTTDHNVNYVMMNRNSIFIQNMRWFFQKGIFRFKDLACKEALMKAISY